MGNLRPFRPFLIILAVFVVASLALEHINGRFWLNDFRVYYMAADSLRHGLPVYEQVFGEDTGLYKYAPVVLYFFLPYTFLSFHAAGIIHFLLIGVFALGCFVVVERSLARLRPSPQAIAGRALLAFLCIVVLLVRELHMGNINMELILLSTLGVERLLADRRQVAGILLGAVWLIKPYLLLMLVPLVIRQAWRVLRTAGITMVAGLVAPLILHGPGTGWTLTRQWFHSMLYHTQVMFSPDYLGQLLATHAGTPLSPWINLLFIALAGLSLTAFSIYNRRQGPEREGMDRTFELWLAMAIVPNLVITDQQHFMFSLPLIAFILLYLFTFKDRLALAAFVGTMLLYATRSSDLWSSDLENRLTGWGILGISNLLLLGLAIWVLHRWRTAEKATPAQQAVG